MDCAHAINAKVLATLLRLEGQGVGGGTGRANVELLDTVLAHVGDVDKGTHSRGVAAIRLNVGPNHPHTEGVRRGGGGHLPLDGTHPQLGPDAVLICLRQQHLAASKVVAFDIS